MLVSPNSSCQFMVEVDASEVGVDKVIFHCSPRTARCTLARFILIVCHQLKVEGSGVPYIVWTDHKNLENIRSAKRLNSREA